MRLIGVKIFQDGGNTLTGADTLGSQAVLFTAAPQLVANGHQETGSSGPDGMSDSEGTAVDIHHVFGDTVSLRVGIT